MGKLLILLGFIFLFGCAGLSKDQIIYYDIDLQCRTNPEMRLNVPKEIPDIGDWTITLRRYTQVWCFVIYSYPEKYEWVILIAKCFECEISFLVHRKVIENKTFIKFYKIDEKLKAIEISETVFQEGMEALKNKEI